MNVIGNDIISLIRGFNNHTLKVNQTLKKEATLVAH